MDKVIRVCDHCGDSDTGVTRFVVEVGSQNDAAGSSETLVEEIDLCPMAQCELINRTIEFCGRSASEPTSRYEWGKQFVARWKKRKV